MACSARRGANVRFEGVFGAFNTRSAVRSGVARAALTVSQGGVSGCRGLGMRRTCKTCSVVANCCLVKICWTWFAFDCSGKQAFYTQTIIRTGCPSKRSAAVGTRNTVGNAKEIFKRASRTQFAVDTCASLQALANVVFRRISVWTRRHAPKISAKVKCFGKKIHVCVGARNAGPERKYERKHHKGLCAHHVCKRKYRSCIKFKTFKTKN